ncbi:MAG: hypothetical protein M5R36_21835 [Deltaproteobacteria bacterium]|nr:hypothetical protein [Deltaproteobacteria bacterium]
MDRNFLILAIPATFAFAALFAHAVAVRGWKTAAAFFGALWAFGILRGNLVYLITRGRPPYQFELPLMKLGHTGAVEGLGWCIALYVSWCLAERLLTPARDARDEYIFHPFCRVRDDDGRGDHDGSGGGPHGLVAVEAAARPASFAGFSRH